MKSAADDDEGQAEQAQEAEVAAQVEVHDVSVKNFESDQAYYIALLVFTCFVKVKCVF